MNSMLQLQKCLFLNFYIYPVWVLIVGFFLYIKLDLLGHLTKYLSLSVYILLILIEFVRLNLGQYGNLSCRVPELADFLMMSALMQLPLVSFFLFNPYLLSTPTELILHGLLYSLCIVEALLSFVALKQASALAKSIYLTHKH